jgi:hypothetical protein
MTRSEAELLWKVLLALRRGHNETAYALARGLFNAALREFAEEEQHAREDSAESEYVD